MSVHSWTLTSLVFEEQVWTCPSSRVPVLDDVSSRFAEYYQ